MKSGTLILASMTLFVSTVSPAVSGPCATEIDGLRKMFAAKDAGSGPTVGATSQAQTTTGSSREHPPTAVMGQETQNKAMSPEDVRRQTQGQPTAAQQGTSRMGASAAKMDEASATLLDARVFDAQGKEAECMDAVRKIKDLIEPNK
jgi:hypothetical protein